MTTYPKDPWDLWVSYKAHPTIANRNVLIEHYVHIVRPIVRQYCGRCGGDFDTCLSNGYLGLIDAVERFEPSRGTAFFRYAYRRIRGAILDGVRTEGPIPRKWMLHSRMYGKPVPAFNELEAAWQTVGTMEESAIEQEREESIEELRVMARGLSTSQQFSVVEYYGRDRLMRDIAADLGLSESCVSQLLTDARRRIRNRLTGII